MKSRLILIEGIPGSGKTTTARKIHDYLENIGFKVKLYNEGDFHPADLAWISYLSLEEYDELLNKYKKYTDVIKKYTIIEDNHALVTYTKLGIQDKELMQYLENHEVYNARVSFDEFTNIMEKRWNQFGKNVEDDTVIIFECAYLQNNINELLAYHNKNKAFIIKYMKKLINNVIKLEPILFYLSHPSVEETIRRVTEERRSPDKSKWEDWIDLVIQYIENCPYGKEHDLKGYDGVIEYFQRRKVMELDVIKELPINTTIVENKDYNWEQMLKQIYLKLDKLL